MTMTDDEKRMQQRGTTARPPIAGRGASDARAQGDVEDDPLAELIRIVKEEDPFGDLRGAAMPGGRSAPGGAGAPAAAPRPAMPSARTPTRNPPPAPAVEPQVRAAPRVEPAMPARPAAPTARADAPLRRDPPPLDPIDLDQALRDFRDAPEDVLRRDLSWSEDGPDPTEAAPRAEPGDAYQDPAFAGFEEGDYPDYEADDEEAAYAVDPYAGDAQYSEPEARRPRHGRFFAVGILMGLVGLGGAAGFLYSQGIRSDADDGPLPVIRADNQPVKVPPDDPGGTTIPNQERLVFNRVSGETAEPETRIVSREEEILAPPSAPAKEEARFPGAGAVEEAVTGTATETPDAGAPQPGSLAPLASAPPATGGIAPVPRRVKTVVVRPDGSIVTIEPQEPAGEPPAPAVQAADAAIPTPPSRPAAPPVRLAASGNASDVTPVQPVRGAPLALNPQPVRQGQQAPQAAPRTVARAVPPQTTVAPQSPAPAAPTALGAESGSVEYVVQLAARRSEEQASQAFDSLKARYAGLLGRYQPLIQRADLGEAGVYYRVRVGPMASAATANELCTQLKAAGLPDCLVRRR